MRLADLDDRLRRGAAGPASDGAATDGAATDGAAERTELALIAAEHERVRVRLSAIAGYEERLRRLETHSDTAETTVS